VRAKLIGQEKHPSKYGGVFYYFFFKDEKGKSLRSCVTPNCRNFKNWEQLLGKEGITIDNLKVKRHNGDVIVDADSVPKIVDEVAV
jgi:hypothetical protein